MLDAEQRDFVESRRTATLVTISGSGLPRPVPICFVLAETDHDVESTLLYSPLDEKPKRSVDVRALARVRDIAARPEVTLLFERWSEDWSAVEALRVKYPQYRAQRIENSPIIRIVVDEAIMWSAQRPLDR